ncbi:MAG: aromatic amino acid lyase [bacterium]
MGVALVLTGADLTPEDLIAAASDPEARVRCAPEGLEQVRRCRAVVDASVAAYTAQHAAWRAGTRAAPPGAREYGVTTGFGRFKDVPIPPTELAVLQANLLPSHAAGVGTSTDPADSSNYFAPEIVRAVLLLRVNAFLKGHSGVRVELVETLLAWFHAGVVPRVPIRGSLGASGDLCPLAHLFLPLLGQGEFQVGADRTVHPGAEIGRFAPLPSPAISHKEGLALINGATFSAALLAQAVVQAERLVDAADVGCALAVEAIAGCARAFDERIHAARNHPGQQASAARIRALLAGSRGVEARGEVQDPYCVRCAPAVHGASRDALAYARRVVEAELNAATDNPLFFPDGGPPFDAHFAGNWPAGHDGRARVAYSAGNFHGQPIAMAADVLTLAVAELASIGERRTQMLLDAHHSHGLPASLTARPGLHSGYMIAQYTAASLVSENKVLAHPAVVDSIPSSANIEDHVPMALVAARKLMTVVHTTAAVQAIEVLVGAQAVEWRHAGVAPPAPGTDPLQASEDRATAFAAAVDAAGRARIASRLGRGTARFYKKIREVVPPLLADRLLATDIRTAQVLVASGGLSGPILPAE